MRSLYHRTDNSNIENAQHVLQAFCMHLGNGQNSWTCVHRSSHVERRSSDVSKRLSPTQPRNILRCIHLKSTPSHCCVMPMQYPGQVTFREHCIFLKTAELAKSNAASPESLLPRIFNRLSAVDQRFVALCTPVTNLNCDLFPHDRPKRLQTQIVAYSISSDHNLARVVSAKSADATFIGKGGHAK